MGWVGNMSDLQMGLIGLGVLLVAAVWIYNLWQEKRQRRQAESLLPPAAPDVLMAGRGAATQPESAPAAVLREPTFAAAPPVRPLPEEPDDDDRSGTQPVPAEWGDGRTDCLVRVEFVDAVPVAELWNEHASWSATIDKPIQWLGLDERSRRWRQLLPQGPGAVTQLAAALQLVDRKGAVSAATLAAFLDGMHRLSQRFAGLVELPAPVPLLELAGALDAFCADVDLQFALQVLPAKAEEMAGAQLQPVLDADRLRREGEVFVAMDDAGVAAFTLVCSSPTAFSAARLTDMKLTGLVFSLDVPRVAAGTLAFDRMIGCARRSAEALGGQLADAHRKPLTVATVAAIRGRIEDLQRQMAERDIPAGSVRALRLFS